MNEIINAGVPKMSTREVAELCGKEHAHVMRDAREMLDQLGIEVKGYLQNWIHPQNQQSYVEIVLTKDLSLTLVSGYSVVLRKRIIDRWLELEAAGTFNVPTTLAGALRLAAEQAEQIEAQARQIESAKPAVAFVEKYVDATGLLGFRQVCKLLRANENRFREFLLDRGIWYRLGAAWVPHAQHIDAGRCVVKAGVSTANDHAFNSARFTPKGVEWIAGEWAKYELSLKLAEGLPASTTISGYRSAPAQAGSAAPSNLCH